MDETRVFGCGFLGCRFGDREKLDRWVLALYNKEC